MKQRATLKEWYRAGNFLIGKVFGHPSFEDGTEVGTSTVLSLQDDIAETKNTIYKLENEQLTMPDNETKEIKNANS